MLGRRLRRWPSIKNHWFNTTCFLSCKLVAVAQWSKRRGFNLAMYGSRVFCTSNTRRGPNVGLPLPCRPLRGREWIYLLYPENPTWRWLRAISIARGGGPRVVISTAVFHARVRSSVPGLGGLKETKNVYSPSTCESQYCGEPLWPRGIVLGLRPPGLEFRILCLEDSVISMFSPSSGGTLGPV